MIDLNLIFTFLEVARSRSLGAAAKRLHVTPPAVSQRIRALEDQIGKSLFLRKKSGMEPNREGREFIEVCSDLRSSLTRIDDWISTQRGVVKGEVLIASVLSPSCPVFPGFLKQFLDAYPNVKISLNEVQGSAAAEADVLSGKADIGLIVGECQKPSLKMQRIPMNNEVYLVCSPRYFLAKKKRITKEDFQKSRLILHSPTHGRTTRVAFKEIGISADDFSDTIIVPNMESSKYHIMSGVGVALIAKMYIFEELKKGDLVILPGLCLRRPAYLISRNEKYETSAVTMFKKEFVKFCSEFSKKLKN